LSVFFVLCVCLFVCLFVGWLVGWLVGRLVGWFVGVFCVLIVCVGVCVYVCVGVCVCICVGDCVFGGSAKPAHSSDSFMTRHALKTSYVTDEIVMSQVNETCHTYMSHVTCE